MVDYFDILYSSIQNCNPFLTKLKFYSLERFFVRIIANLIIPVYFSFTCKKKCYRLQSKRNAGKRIIVSLTSFPSRIDRIWIVIESLLRQSVKPDMIILWLSKEQFPELERLPRKLLGMQERGVIIRLCNDDIRSHKKYWYVLQEFPTDYVVTVDDDVIYNSNIINYLMQLSKEYSNAVCCNRASYIGFANGKILPYVKWKLAVGKSLPTNQLMPIGVGGVLYPPNSLFPDVLNDSVFRDICFFADDIWLNAMCYMNGGLVSKTDYHSDYLPVLSWRNKTLNSVNISLGKNDIQLTAVRNYLINKYSVDPYEKLFNYLNTNL